uniref:Uncharacterized protein n=1 Tax=Arundo donax TaxID=35708 RepID=A0A0A9HX70_ARUDO
MIQMRVCKVKPSRYIMVATVQHLALLKDDEYCSPKSCRNNYSISAINSSAAEKPNTKPGDKYQQVSSSTQ